MKNLSATTDISAARERLASDFSSLISHAEELLQATTTLSGESVDMARQRLTDSIEQVKSQIGPARDYAIEKARMAVDQAVTYARERPWQVVAAAVLVGLFVSFISSGSRRSS